jgi:hypothetical protein
LNLDIYIAGGLAPVVSLRFCAIVSANLFVYFYLGHRLGLHDRNNLGLNRFGLYISLDFLNLRLIFNLFCFGRSFGLLLHFLVGIPSFCESGTLGREL